MKRLLWIFAILFLLLCGLGSYLVRGLKKPDQKDVDTVAVTKGDVVIDVIDTGSIAAVKTVEVKSRVSGRLAKLLVDEGDTVKEGQLIAIIDPKETKLLVDQGRAQLRGAQSSVQKSSLEIQQRKVTALAAYKQAQSRLNQLQAESGAQPTLTNALITQAQTTLESALHERERLVNSAHPSQRASTLASKKEAEANFEAAKLEYARQQELLTKEFTSARLVEQARQNVDVARARLESTTESLNRLEAQLAVELSKADEQVRQARSQLDSARANSIQDKVKREDYLAQIQQVNQARAALQDVGIMEKSRMTSQAQVDQLSSSLADSERQLGETEIRAPISGIVTKKLMQEGELVASLSSFSSGSAIVQIEDRSTMIVKMDVNEIDTARMTVGMPSKITVDALPDLKLQGTVKKIAPSSNATAGGQDPVVKYSVEVTIVDKDARIRSGMSARVNLRPAERKGVLTLPIEYVVKDGDKRFVELPIVGDPKPDQKPERKEIKTGLESGSTVEIVSGLKVGDKVHRPAFNGPARKGFMQAGGDGG